MSVVVVAAHPEDELLGPGGTLAAHAQAGEDVHAIILTEGATSRYEPGMADVLRRSGWEAAKHIGLSSVSFEGLPDERLDTCPIIEIIQRVGELLKSLDPTVVYTHFAGDLNADHAVVAQAVWRACGPLSFPRLRRLAAFETPLSTGASLLATPPFVPTLYVDVSSTIEDKLAAMAAYGSEIRPYPHPRSLRSMRERAAVCGSTIGVAAAEPFVILREQE